MGVVLIPGFMLDADLWRDVEPALAGYGRIIHADLSKDSTIPEMASRAISEATPEFVLIGFSMGGYVAREIVRQAPERVTALVLIATSARGDSDIQKRRKAAMSQQTSFETFSGLSAAAVKSSLHPDSAHRIDLVSSIQAMGRRLGGEVFKRQSLLARRDERSELGSIRCPSLVIAGAQDNLRSKAEATELHQGLAGSTFEIVEATGHMIPLEAPQQLAKIIVGWLSRLPR